MILLNLQPIIIVTIHHHIIITFNLFQINYTYTHDYINHPWFAQYYDKFCCRLPNHI